MVEKGYLIEYLEKSSCYKCKRPLDSAKLETITEAPLAIVAHAICSNCEAESMITITASGGGVTPLLSDLDVTEFRKFMGAKSVSYDELLDLHKALKKTSLCNLMDNKENSLEKKQNI